MTDLIVEADGGSRGNPGVAGYGSLVRDAATGRILAERAAPLGKQSNNVAEYTGLIEGLRAVVEHRPGVDVVVRMDSKLVVEQMSGRWKIKHEDMKRLAAQARELAADIAEAGGSVTYTWIPRAENKAADKLSNDGMDGVTVTRDVWDVEAPTSTTRDASVAERSGAAGDAEAAAEGPARRATRLLLVRHAVTRFTLEGRLDGRGGADPELTEQGREQAEQLAQAVPAYVDDEAVVITSSLARAVETGARIAQRLGVEAEADADWDEQAFGDWDGLSFAEIRDLDAAGLAALRHDPAYAPAGGEARQELDARIERALDRVRTRGGTVIVVTHRIPAMSVLAQVLGLDVDAAWRLTIAPASLTGLELPTTGRGSVAFTNDTHHLR